jgi:N-formylmaleamate deformylase
MMPRLFRVLLLSALCALPAPVSAADAPLSFAVHVEGTGPPMILIPGFLSGGDVWEDVVAAYRDRYQCHVLTLPGFASQPAIEAPVLPRVRDEIIAYIRERRLDRPVLVGHSLGGFLALWIAATAPELVGPVISVDGVPFLAGLQSPSATPEAVQAQAAQMAALYATMTREQLALQTRLALTSMITDPAHIEGAAAWAAESDPKAAGAMIEELMSTDLRDAVASIASPVLLVGAGKAFAAMPGGLDRARAAYEAQVARIPDRDVVLATRALHFVMYDDLPFLLETMDGFLGAAAGKGR